MLVYLGTNTVNGMVYVGATRRPSLATRLAEHKSRAMNAVASRDVPLFKAIRKYGWDAFRWEVVERCDSPKDVERAEQRWIAHLGSMNRRVGYNRAAGGGGTIGAAMSDETRAKMSASLRKRHAEHPASAETRQKRSAALKGRKPSPQCIAATKARVVSAETRALMSAQRRGRKIALTDAGRAGIAAAAKRRAAAGVGAKVRPNEWAAIRDRRAAGESFARIGRDYGVTPSCIFYFCKRHAAGGSHP